MCYCPYCHKPATIRLAYEGEQFDCRVCGKSSVLHVERSLQPITDPEALRRLEISRRLASSHAGA